MLVDSVKKQSSLITHFCGSVGDRRATITTIVTASGHWEAEMQDSLRPLHPGRPGYRCGVWKPRPKPNS